MEIQYLKITEEDRILLSSFIGEDYLGHAIDFNRLMPVVEKIENLGYWTEICYSYLGTNKRREILRWCEVIKENHTNLLLNDCDTKICRGEGDTKIEAVWLAVIEFIKYYNTCQKEK